MMLTVIFVLFSVLPFVTGLTKGGFSVADSPAQLSFKYSTEQRGIFVQEDATINTNPPDYVCKFRNKVSSSTKKKKKKK